MGWTCLEQRYSNFDFSTAKGRKAYLDSEFTNEYLQVLSSSLMGNVYYAAVKHHFDSKEGYYHQGDVFGLVILVQMHRQNGESELCYKDIDETMMPYCFDCPQKILKQLTPTDNEYAKQWRSLCEQWQYRKLLLRKCRQTDDTITIRRENDCNDMELFYNGLYKKWLEVKQPQYYVKVNEILPNLIRVGSHEIKRFRDLVD